MKEYQKDFLAWRAVEFWKEQKRKGRNIHSLGKVMYSGSSTVDLLT